MAEGVNGWTNQQGFYIYRGKRLMLAGDWLGLFRKEEHYKLVRIQIDLPNKLDTDWQIDIKKSTARPPLVSREQIKKIRSCSSQSWRRSFSTQRQNLDNSKAAGISTTMA